MESLFQKVDKDLSNIHLNLRTLEQAPNENNAQPIFQIIFVKISDIKANLNMLDRSINKEEPNKRRTLRYRYDQLKLDCNNVESSINSLQTKLTTKWQLAAEREELLTRRFKPNETHLDVDDSEFYVNDHLKRSHTAVDDLLLQGAAVLNVLKNQHMELRGVKSKIVNIGQTLGLSTTTLQFIEKRLENDWLLFIILAILFTIFMYCFYRYWNS